MAILLLKQNDTFIKIQKLVIYYKTKYEVKIFLPRLRLLNNYKNC